MNEYLLQTFLANRALTYDILDSLPESELNRLWKRPGLNTYSKHFLEMASVLEAYSNAFATKVMDFSEVSEKFEESENYSKQQLKEKLMKSDEVLKKICISDQIGEEIFWFDMNIPAEIHFVNIISHEVFHQGMMVMDMYQNSIDIPLSVAESWSLPVEK